jgi:hypothetical protein
MKNKEITIYELLGLIKDGKAPKKILYNGHLYTYTKNLADKMQYISNEIRVVHFLNFDEEILDDKVKIQDETDDEFEDIEEMYINGIPRDISNEQLDNQINNMKMRINQLIRNQKKIIERLNGEDNE